MICAALHCRAEATHHLTGKGRRARIDRKLCCEHATQEFESLRDRDHFGALSLVCEPLKRSAA